MSARSRFPGVSPDPAGLRIFVPVTDISITPAATVIGAEVDRHVFHFTVNTRPVCISFKSKWRWGRRNSDGYDLHGHVRFGSLADIGTVSGHVRVTPQKRTSVCALHCAFQLIGNGNKLISYGRVVTRSTACSL